MPVGATATASYPSQANGFDPTGWELALVTTPSSGTSVNDRQLVSPRLSVLCFIVLFVNLRKYVRLKKMENGYNVAFEVGMQVHQVFFFFFSLKNDDVLLKRNCSV